MPQDSTTASKDHGLIVWLTGLSGAGKTTIARNIQLLLEQRGRQTCLVDGDILRAGLCRNLGYSLADREENIRRAGEVAITMAGQGQICLVALISPLRKSREKIRAQLPAGRFLEVFVNAPLEVCEHRDPKGLYARARRDELADFTGISSPYEPPLSPEVEIRTDRRTVEQCVHSVLEFIEQALAKSSPSISSRTKPEFTLQQLDVAPQSTMSAA